MSLLKSKRLGWGLGFALGLLLVMLVSNQCRSTAQLPTRDPLPQDPYLQVYFNHNPAAVYTDPYRGMTRYGDNLEQVIIDGINAAQATIAVAVQELTLPGIAQALAQRQSQGVRVRVVLENQYSQSIAQQNRPQMTARDPYHRAKLQALYDFIDANQDGQLSTDELAQRDALTILDQAQVPRLDDTADGSRGSGLMHHKFMVIDGHRVVTGSANWTLSCIHGDFLEPDSRGNANSLLVVESPVLAQAWEREFDLLWGDGPGGNPDSRFGLQKPYRPPLTVSLPGSAIALQFSPTSSTLAWADSVNGLIGRTLSRARHSLNLALFVFSDQGLSNQIQAVSQRGVSVKALIDPGFAYRSYSEALDMLGLALPDPNCRMEAHNQPWSQPLTTVGIPTLPPTDKLHHKFAVIDAETVVVGSHNWSRAANQTNDENLLVIRNATVAAHYQREFDRLYDQAQLGMTPQLQSVIAKQRDRCQL
ncbi:MAG: phospholipase D-like domain-containing protein [Nodosilinea sp.]